MIIINPCVMRKEYKVVGKQNERLYRPYVAVHCRSPRLNPGRRIRMRRRREKEKKKNNNNKNEKKREGGGRGTRKGKEE